MTRPAQEADSPRVFSIEPGDAFLPRLAASLLAGEIIPGFGVSAGPLALASATIFVPTRRAARALRAALATRIDAAGALLPDIRALGEFGEEALDLAMADGMGPGGPAHPLPPPPIGAEARLFALAPLVARWRERLPGHIARRLGGIEGVVLPASPADTIRLARALADLLDETAREEGDWTRLARAAEGSELAGWFELTTTFLSIVTEAWPQALAGLGRSDPAAHMRALIDACTASLAAGDPARVVIAAGSTGSIPATARLLSAIARMPRGAVILPGLDAGLPATAFDALQNGADATLRGHPQYGLARLLARMGVPRGAVRPLGGVDAPRAARRRFVSEALLPVDETGGWGGAAAPHGALAGIALMEAANEREEALAIACAMREALAEPGETVALVTPDRALARRVTAELRRFGIGNVDDSGGVALAETPEAGLLLRLAAALFRAPAAAALAGLVKHPLFAFGRPPAAMRRLAARFELIVLRGRKGRLRPFALADETRAAFLFHDDPSNRAGFGDRIDAAERDGLLAFAEAFDAAVAPLAGPAPRPLSDWLWRLAAAAARFGTPAEGADDGTQAPQSGAPVPPGDGEAARSLARMLSGVAAAAGDFPVAPADLPDVLDALLEGRSVKPAPGGHPRAFIWGVLEARLQDAGTLILGGLNEGVWPPAPDAGPFLARPMRAAIGLEAPERRIGQSAHDFEQALGARRIILSRSLKSGAAPSEPARWLQRMLALAGPDGAAQLRAGGARRLALARRIDLPERIEPPAKRPEPRPPAALRPKRYSVTEIDTLRRDPYAIHARRILGLAPLPALTRDPGAAERGLLFHAILADMANDGLDPAAPDALARLLALAGAHFKAEALEPDIHALWWPRFAAIAPRILAFEAERAPQTLARLAECKARPHPLPGGETLTARADRIDRLAGGGVAVFDWKTGSSPAKVDARKLRSAQLALEAALVARGAFPEVGAAEVGEIAFLRLKDKGVFEVETIFPWTTGNKTQGHTTVTPAGSADTAWQRLLDLLSVFRDERHPFVSRAHPWKRQEDEADYDHLARYAEWSATGDEGDGGEEDGDGGDEDGEDGS